MYCMRLTILVTLQTVVLFFIIWSYSDFTLLQSLLLAVTLSLPTLLFVRRRKEERIEVEKREQEKRLKPLFRKCWFSRSSSL